MQKGISWTTEFYQISNFSIGGVLSTFWKR